MSGNNTILAHWYYEPDEWGHFTSSELAKAQSQFRRFVYSLLLVALAIPFLVVFIDLASGRQSNVVSTVFWFFAFEIIGAGILGGVVFLSYRATQERLAALRLLHPEIMVTQVFVIYGGADYLSNPYHRIQPLWRDISTTTEAGDPPTMWIEVSYAVVGAYGQSFRIPVPHGHEDEGTEVAKQLRKA